MDLISCSNHNDDKKTLQAMSLQHLFWKEIAGKMRKKSGQVVGEKGKKKGGPGGF